MTKRAGKTAKRKTAKSKAEPPKGKTTAKRKPRKRASKTRKPKPGSTVLAPAAGRGETAKDTSLVGRAVRERWQSTDELRTALRKRVVLKAMTTEDPRALAALAKVDVQMEAQNQKDQLAFELAANRMDIQSSPLAGATIQNAQVVIYVPDNNRGLDRQRTSSGQ